MTSPPAAPRRTVVPGPPEGALPLGDSARHAEGLSAVARGMTGSEILRIAAEVRRIAATGRPVCDLTVGDFDPRQFPVPAALRDGLRAAVSRGETNYPPSDGLPALREAVRRRIEIDLGLRYPLESILIASGVRPLLYGTARILLDHGDRVVYGVPSWNTNHYAWLTGAEGVPVRTSREHGFHPSLDDLAPHLAGAALVCLCSPANPTGTMIDPAELKRITLAIARENQVRDQDGRRPLYLLYDQVYGSLVHGGESHAHPVALVPEAAAWTITLDGISKAYAATGLRVGWSVAPPAITAVLRDFLGHVGAWAPRPEQVATAEFLADDGAIAAYRAEMDRAVRDRLDALCDGFAGLREAGYPVDWVRPAGAIYLSLQLGLVGRTVAGRPIVSNDDLRRLLLEEAGLALVPFQAFGLPDESGWFRVSVGAASLGDIAAAFPRIRDLFDRVDRPAD